VVHDVAHAVGAEEGVKAVPDELRLRVGSGGEGGIYFIRIDPRRRVKVYQGSMVSGQKRHLWRKARATYS
jgi:hypothetical protein